jgi:hypothetical protein
MADVGDGFCDYCSLGWDEHDDVFGTDTFNTTHDDATTTERK